MRREMKIKRAQWPLLLTACGLLGAELIAAEVAVADEKSLHAGFVELASEYGPRAWWHWITPLRTAPSKSKLLEVVNFKSNSANH